MANRRELQLKDLDEAVEDARKLLAGYEAVGNWTLAQACGHCANWLGYPMVGFPRPHPLMGIMMWMMKVSVGPGVVKKVIRERSMPSGNPTIKSTIPSNDDDDAAGVEKLAQTVEDFKHFEGDFIPSPLFGRLDRASLHALNTIHCQHHLSFFIPKS